MADRNKVTVGKKDGRQYLNTNVDKEILDNFRIACAEINTPMNTILEAFMKQFGSGELDMKFTVETYFNGDKHKSIKFINNRDKQTKIEDEVVELNKRLTMFMDCMRTENETV